MKWYVSENTARAYVRMYVTMYELLFYVSFLELFCWLPLFCLEHAARSLRVLIVQRMFGALSLADFCVIGEH